MRVGGPGPNQPVMQPGLTLTVTRDPDAIREARRLRHAVFVEELGAVPAAGGPAAGGLAGEGLEGDDFDAECDHVILRDPADPAAGVVATLRVGLGTAYTEQEFDLSALKSAGRPLAEAGRACLHPAYRGGMAGFILFKGLLNVLHSHEIAFAVGTASFPGADLTRHLPGLRRLRHAALAPESLRPVAHGDGAVVIEGEAPRSAMAGVPALIKTYLRAGAQVGDGAYIDRAFNTVDVCMVLDLSRVALPGLPR